MKKIFFSSASSCDVLFIPGAVMLLMSFFSCGRPLSASFTASPEKGKAPLEVKLDASKSTGRITTYTWDFGDGQSGSGVKTSHIYNNAGNPQIALTVTDQKGKKKTATKVIEVIPDNKPPVAAFTFNPSTGDAPLLVTFDASAASDSDGSIVSYQWDFGDGQQGTGKITTHRYESAGEYAPSLLVTDNNGAQHTANQLLKVSGLTLPPDPATVAPAVDQTVVTDFASATEFLYTGTNPIQTGVAPGTMDERRVAVLRGKVIDRKGEAISGVEITVLNHPEYGKTLSRADGMFDLAVNGGGITTCVYKKDKFLPVHRQENVPWKDYVWLDDVVLIPYDSSVTTIDLTAPVAMQVAQGSISNDQDGERQPTLLIPQGTKAEMMMADGSTKPINNLQIRLTEYTVGENGPLSMPAPLPPTTGYTYAVELSVDEVVQNGTKLNGKDVLLNQPIYHYLENFLNFPVGTIVPVGYYDNTKASWVPSKNGLVIKVHSITDGLANLEVDSSGFAASQNQYTALNISDDERRSIGTLYQVAQTLWRVPLTHLSTYDFNCPAVYWTVADCKIDCAPEQPKPEVLDKPLDDPCKNYSSIIEVQNQILGELVNISGAGISLHYQSDRVPGYKVPYALKINLSDSYLPDKLIRIELVVFVAGRRFNYSYPPSSNLSVIFTWDGKDAYGRLLSGKQPVVVEIGYVYPATYNATQEQLNAFAAYAASGILASSRGDFVFRQTHATSIGAFGSNNLGMGGWSIDKHHIYDPSEKVLYLGNGQRRTAESLSYEVIQTIAGSSNFAGYSGDSAQATQAKLWEPRDLAVGPDGSVYIAEGRRIRKVSPTGIITTVAGDGQNCAISTAPCGDGGSALNAQLSDYLNIGFDVEGNLYIADYTNHRIRKINSDGIISTIAGTGEYGYFGAYGDDSLAIRAKISYPGDIAISTDGSIYLTDAFNNVVRRIMPDGFITTVAGDGNLLYSCGEDPCGDGGPATQAKLPLAGGKIALAPDGSLYIATKSNDRIRKVATDGIITTVAGTGLPCNPAFSCGDGMKATQARLAAPNSIAVGPDGTLFICDNSGRIRLVGPDGIISTFAGNGKQGFSGDNGIARNAQFDMPSSVVRGPDGSIYVADTRNNRIRRIASAFPGGSADEILVASEDGSEVYIFTKGGKHLRTLHPLTGATLHEFTYDSAGRLSKITDAEGNATTIQRDGAGIPRSITGPYGHVTQLELNSDGYLSAIINPEGETHTFDYGQDGLLTRFTNPRGFSTTFKYGSLGRLIREDDASGGFFTLSRITTDSGYNVTHTSSLNRITSYQVDDTPIGGQKRTNTFPNGLKSESFKETNGFLSSNDIDGTKQETILGPDPRWGMLAPLTSTSSISTPGGLKSTFSSARTATLTNSENLFSLSELIETVNINGRIYISQYNAASRTITQKSPLGKKSTATIDTLGRLTRTEIEGILPVRFSYNSRGRLDTITQGSGTDMRRTIFGYNNQGFLEKVTNPLNQTVIFEHDQVGRIKKQTMADGRVIGYTYDANGNLATLTPPGKPAHSFSYSPIDQVTQYTPPDVFAGRDETQYTYNTDRELTQIIRPDGDTVKLDYSEGGSCDCGRLSSITINRGEIKYVYDDSTGNLKEINAPNSIDLSYTYDGALVTGKTWSGEVSGSVNYGYDNDFRLNKISLNGQDTIAYQYDNDGLLIQAGALMLHRDPKNGLLTGSTLGNVLDSISYNNFGEIESYKALHGNNLLYDFRFTRDKLGRIEQKIETFPGAVDTFGYVYDLAGRLKEVWKNGIQTDNFTYDDNGNRLSHTNANSTTVTGTYDDQDRLKQYGNATYTYTANGELKSKIEGSDTTTYRYDELGNLLAVTLSDGKQIEYLIDGQNRRIGKKVNGVLVQGFLYEDGLRPIAELDGNGNIVSRFVYATRVNVPDYMIKNGVIYRIITDYLGSPRLVVNMSTGQVEQQIAHDAFGNVVSDSIPEFTPFGFAGGLYDGDSKLMRFGARDYDAWVGRWNAKDPELFNSKETNFYSYSINDPINLIDPTGLFGEDIRLPSWLEDLSIPQGIVDFSAGFGSVVSFGTTSLFNEWTGADKFVDKCSGAYTGGQIAGAINLMIIGGPRGGAALGRTRIGHVLNHNRYLRIGPGRMPANGPFPAGTHVPRISIGPQRPGFKNPHFDLRIRGID